MSNIIKSSSGLMFSENFGNGMSLLWDLSPNEQDRVVKNNDSISLLNNNSSRIKMTIPIPTENNYIVQSKISFEPVSSNDKAGLTVESLTDIRVDFEVCGDDEIKADYMKLCVDEYGILSAYASWNNKWINYGNTKLNNANSIGFYNESEKSPIKLYDCIVYKNNFITINGFDRKNYIKVFDKNHNEITGDFFIKKYNTRIVLDGIYNIFPIEELTVDIYRIVDDTLVTSHTLTNIYGGDVYEFKYDLELKINNQIIENDDKLFDLGEISKDTVFDITITNKESFDITDKTVRISYYSYLNNSYKFVKIAKEQDDKFNDKIENINFLSGSNTKIKLQINKNTIYSELDEQCKFSIIIE